MKIDKREEVKIEDTEDKISEIPVVKELKIKRAKMKFKFSLMSRILILFILGLMVIYRFAQITEISYKTNDIVSECEGVTAENTKLQIAIQREIDLSKIREIAESRLGLQAPDESQIIYIDTTATDRVDFLGTEEWEKPSGIDSVINWIKSFFVY